MNETNQTIPEKHNAKWYSKSAYECFIKNADNDTSDADPVAAIRRVFNQRASDDLKAQVASEGKTAEGAYQFLWSVARLCRHTDGGCHISPETGYAIAMHYFQDVPKDVLDEFEPSLKAQKDAREAAERKEKADQTSAEKKNPSQKKAKVNKPTPTDKTPKKPKEASDPKSNDEQSKHATTPYEPSPAQMSLFDQLI